MVKRRKSKKKQKKGLDSKYIYGAFVIFVIAIFSYAVVKGYLFPTSGGGSPGNSVRSLGNQHVVPGESHIAYNSDPPTSGPHYQQIATWGIHSTPVEKELQIHNLEDGGVMVQYNCDSLDEKTCGELVASLRAISKRYDKAILAPYSGMDRVIALTAWGRIDKFDEFDNERIERFISAYIGLDHHGR